jgi:hypothetical protein
MSPRLIIICGKSPRRRFLRVLLPTECGENAGSFSCDLNHRLAVFEPSFGGALFVSPLDPLFVIPFWI